ncbi:MAG: DUF5711 family protein, partial [bacterium]|nr:DUF5711 family protein [bacterium]
MWENTDEASSGRPYLWFVFFLLLILSSSIFVLQPSIRGGPSNGGGTKINVTAIPFAVTGQGTPILMRESSIGIWLVRQDVGRAVINHFGESGEEQWNESVVLTSTLASSSGSYLLVAEAGKGQLVLYHAKNKLSFVHTIVGAEIQAISVSDTGDALVCYTTPQAEPMKLSSYVSLISSTGVVLWKVPRENITVISCALASDSSRAVILG